MLSVLDLIKITEGSKRPIIEGEAYYDSGLLFAVGLINKTDSTFECQGLAVQTSAVTGKSHEISIVFDKELEAGSRIKALSCSCIAGQSAKCKHAVATVLWLTRHDEDDLADINCTDAEQQWEELKTSGKQVLEGCLLSELCHVEKRLSPDIPEVTEEMRKRWRERLLKCKASG